MSLPGNKVQYFFRQTLVEPLLFHRWPCIKGMCRPSPNKAGVDGVEGKVAEEVDPEQASLPRERREAGLKR